DLLLIAIADCESWLKLLDVPSQGHLQITLPPERGIDCIGNFDLCLDITVGSHTDVGLDSCDLAWRYADPRSDILSIEALLVGPWARDTYRHRGFLPLIALRQRAPPDRRPLPMAAGSTSAAKNASLDRPAGAAARRHVMRLSRRRRFLRALTCHVGTINREAIGWRDGLRP